MDSSMIHVKKEEANAWDHVWPRMDLSEQSNHFITICTSPNDHLIMPLIVPLMHWININLRFPFFRFPCPQSNQKQKDEGGSATTGPARVPHQQHQQHSVKNGPNP